MLLIISFIYLFLAALGLHCFVWTFLELQSAAAALHRGAVFPLQWLLLLWGTGSGVYRLQKLLCMGSRAQAQYLKLTGPRLHRLQ